MKIRLPFTEQFLWDMFHLIEKTDETLSSFGMGYIPQMGDLPFCSDINMRKIYSVYEKKKRRTQFEKLVDHLKRRGYLKPKKAKTESGMIITPKGIEKILRIKRKIRPYPKRPDKKWIMVLFDIPETERELRDELRDKLWTLGFQSLQKSVWICPYDVLHELKSFIERKNLAENVKTLLVKEMNLH